MALPFAFGWWRVRRPEAHQTRNGAAPWCAIGGTVPVSPFTLQGALFADGLPKSFAAIKMHGWPSAVPAAKPTPLWGLQAAGRMWYTIDETACLFCGPACMAARPLHVAQQKAPVAPWAHALCCAAPATGQSPISGAGCCPPGRCGTVRRAQNLLKNKYKHNRGAHTNARGWFVRHRTRLAESGPAPSSATRPNTNRGGVNHHTMATEVFNQFYEGYDDWYTTPMGAFVDEVETAAAFRLLAPHRGMQVLDVGCGTGNFTFKLARMGCAVTGVDVSERMLETATRKARQGGLALPLYRADAAHMPFASGSFDAVLSMAAFEFIENPQAVYSQMKRVVKPGGVVVIGTIQKGGAWARFYEGSAFAGTAYESAAFKGKQQLIALDPGAVTGTSECLYLPPTLEEAQYTAGAEAAAEAAGKTGGFVCVRFQKNL